MLMILVISFIIIIGIYYLLEWLYKEYKEDLNNIDEHTVHAQRRINELERKIMINEQMIKWLCDEVANYKLKKGNKKWYIY